MIADWDVALRLAVAAALGSLIGFERERLLWAAGIRTHMLVSVGACLVMIVSAYGFSHATQMPHVVLDPSRMAAQVVSGVGFLGAGSILLRGNVVRGLTTAASIWSVAAIGLAAGGGLYFAAVLATGIILAILAGAKPLEEAYRARIQSATITVRAERDALDIDRLNPLLGVQPSQIRRVVVRPAEDGLDETLIRLVRVSQRDIRAGSDKLKAVPGVHAVVVRRKPRHDPPGEEAASD